MKFPCFVVRWPFDENVVVELAHGEKELRDSLTAFREHQLEVVGAVEFNPDEREEWERTGHVTFKRGLLLARALQREARS